MERLYYRSRWWICLTDTSVTSLLCDRRSLWSTEAGINLHSDALSSSAGFILKPKWDLCRICLLYPWLPEHVEEKFQWKISIPQSQFYSQQWNYYVDFSGNEQSGAQQWPSLRLGRCFQIVLQLMNMNKSSIFCPLRNIPAFLLTIRCLTLNLPTLFFFIIVCINWKKKTVKGPAVTQLNR